MDHVQREYAGDHSADRVALRALVDAYAHHVDAREVDAVAALFSPEGRLVSSMHVGAATQGPVVRQGRSEIVWALNEKNDSLSDLLSYTRSYAVEYLYENNIDCEVHMATDYPGLFVSGEFRRNIYLAIKEALHNIVKHARASKVVIKIFIDRWLTISVHDNGIGFDAGHVRPFSNGLNICP